MGVNLSALEWGETVIPGTYGTNYTSPTTAEVDYFTGKGMKIIRIPFLWERMQPTLMQPFNTTYRDRVESIVNYATSKAGVFAIVDCHNYHRYNGNIVGSTAVPVDSFVNLWTRIGARFATNPRVMFGLMNEPHDVPGGAAAVRDHQQAVIDALRAAGYGQYILVSGTQWSGGWTWTTSGNAAAMLSLTDPINRTIFDIHQYLDSDGGGSSTTCVSPTIGVERLTDVVNWATTNHKKLLVGEITIGNNTTCNSALTGALDLISGSPSVLGMCYWAAGPWWSTSDQRMIEPISGGDRPQMAILSKYMTPPIPTHPTFRWADGSRTGTDAQKPWEAGDFVERCGINMQQLDANAITALRNWGGKRARVGRAGAVTNALSSLLALGRDGYKFMIHAGVYTSTQSLDSATKMLNAVKSLGPDYVISVSNVNEPNHPEKWTGLDQTAYWQYLRNYQRDLYNAFHNDPATAGKVMVCGPGWGGTDIENIPKIGNIDQWIDAHEFHKYSTVKWGTGKPQFYSEMATYVGQTGSLDKPCLIGETGWHTHQPTWDPKDGVEYKDRYMPRHLLNMIDHGLALLDIYVMDFDNNIEGWSYGGTEQCYGWLKPDGRVQASYTSTKNLLTLLADPGPRFITTPLAYTITGNTAAVYRVLLQERNGTWYLAVWCETQSPQTRAITINLPATITTAARARPNFGTGWTTTTISANKITW